MKTKITLISMAFTWLTVANIFAQVPNGGFENWTNGSPDNWYCTNVPTVVANITQETPSYSGLYAARGEVINFGGTPYPPLLSSVDQAFNGFPISQSYSTFSFYYKMNITSTAQFEGSVTFYDAGGNWVASGGGLLTAGVVNSYTLASFPMNYGSTNPPVECIIIFAIHDTVASNPPIGNYFIVDGVTLSGTVGVEETSNDVVHSSVYPNPSATDASVNISNAPGGNAELFIFDLKGSIVKKYSADLTSADFNWKFSVADLPPGIYAVRIVNEGKQWLSRFVKE